eukprot:scaffold3136_cov123-Isochrysis_galbana.AAC.4
MIPDRGLGRASLSGALARLPGGGNLQGAKGDLSLWGRQCKDFVVRPVHVVDAKGQTVVRPLGPYC